MTDPKSTEWCPTGGRCESCAAAVAGLRTVTIEVLGAIMCLTLCPTCAASGQTPQILLSTAQKLVEQHRQHLAGPDRPTYRTRLPN